MTLEEAIITAKNIYKRQWRDRNRDHVNAYQRKWRRENPDKVRMYNNRYWTEKARDLNLIS